MNSFAEYLLMMVSIIIIGFILYVANGADRLRQNRINDVEARLRYLERIIDKK